MSTTPETQSGIAIIGMAGRFPKAKDVHGFWRNLCNGVEGISFFTDDELQAAGVPFPRNSSNYVKARGLLDGADLFDAEFFGITPREAEVTDPQHRVFLECAWEALENSGYDPAKYPGAIGVFAGMSMNTYLAHNLLAQPELVAQFNEHQLMLGNDKDFLATRVSYKLDLRGPALNIQTACSTSLVAVCVASQNLLAYECDMALAGAVSITFPQRRGHAYQPGGITSPDGHCRPFDAQAAGTVAGEGAGIVVLKRLGDALADGDTIYAVIRGFAVNNDGSNKVGYTAPSVEGQSEVIAAAQAMAGFAPDAISYVEAHGTGTPLGDPIEIEGLTRAFRARTDKSHFCAVGSVKGNIGHLDVAAGVAGLIKTALALHHRRIPPTLHFQSPNPEIDFANSPFYVNAKLAEWPRDERPLRAGVSSFGIGGTNAHVALEEAPAGETAAASRPVQLLMVSARTEAALGQAAANLVEHLKQDPALHLADVAYTLQVGRRDFRHRRMLVCRDSGDALGAWEASDPKRVFTGAVERENPPLVFMFPGQGAQRVNMGLELYQNEAVFREQIDRCCEILQPHLSDDLRTVLYPRPEKVEEAETRLTQTVITQPALFAIEYALAKLWMSWGVVPEAMIGHSIGEYVAACLTEVFTLEDALALVAARGRLMQQLPRGAMLAVRLPEAKVRPFLNGHLSLAAVNASSLCVVSGRTDAVETLRQELDRRDVAATPLHTSHAFHSAMMEPVLKPFADLVKLVKRRPPQTSFISNLSGTWITAGQATDPEYWGQHMRQTVRFADGLGELLKDPERVFLEVGPGHSLGTMAKQHPARNRETQVISSLPSGNHATSDEEALLAALGRLWLAGVPVNWRNFHADERRRRVPLPAYPFERQRFWVEPGKAPASSSASNIGIALPEPVEEPVEPARPRGSSAAESPATNGQITAALRQILGQLSGLNFDEISGDATFAEAGFDSLALTQVSLAIDKRLGVCVPFRQLLEDISTLNALAAHIENTLPRHNGCPRVEPDQNTVPREQVRAESNDVVTIPLTDSQKEIWFATQMGDAASCAFNECRLLHLRGALRADVIVAALRQLVARHEALRATFAPEGGVQAIRPEANLDVPTIDWSRFAAEDRWLLMDRLQNEEARRPFDLPNGPLLRAQLVCMAGQHHVLILTVHHIVCDGHSFGTLLRELGVLYSAGCRNASPDLPAPLQLSEYVRNVEHRNEDAGHAAAEAYWLGQFADGVPVLELPADAPRPATWTFTGARETRLLPEALARALKQFASRQDCTLFTTLLAVYVVLLRRLTGQEELTVGIPTADRALEGGDSLVAHCISFLPLRVKIPGNPPFADFLGGLRQTFLDAHDHRCFAFGQLIQKLDLSRDRSRMPLVSATFNVERLKDDLQFAGLQCELAANPASFTSFDLSFNVLELNGALQLDCRYNTALFAPGTVRRWLEHFQNLVEDAVANPRQQVAALPMLSPAERRRILVEWNNTDAAFPRDKCLHQLFEVQAGRTPDAVAIAFRDQTLTYRELNRRANRLARRLREKGIGPDKIVALSMDRSLEMVTAIFGVLKAGGAYLPLDAGWPIERLNYMLENSRAQIVLKRADVVAAMAPTSAKDDENPESHVTPRNLAYVIYTSGSTGRPKGVAIEHRNTVNFLHWANRVFSPEEFEGVLFSTSICFDLSIFELFAPLTRGGSAILVEDVLELPSLPRPEEIKLINTVPSAIRELLRLGAVPRSVRTINLAGEPLPASLADQIYEQTGVTKVYDLYGPSETTTYSTFALRQRGGPAAIGRPIGNTQIYLLDDRLQPVPVGVPGQIYIGGEGVARGYLHAPELTAGRFLSIPPGIPPSSGSVGRLYKTGDLARWLPDGNLEYRGRMDNQVKIRGYRVELGEIETALAQHAVVRECVVVAREDSPGQKQLAAYLVQEPDKPAATVGELRRFLESKLPAHMVPAAFVLLDALPMTPNGKINRSALPAPDPLHPELAEGYSPPVTPTGKALAQIWREVLRLEQVGVQDDFFDLGGHSLLMTQVISRVRGAFQVELPMRSFFESPTIAALAVVIEALIIKQADRTSDGEARPMAHSNG